jgi:two-component system OmpR family sensor kinase
LVALVAVPLETVQHSLESLLLILGLSMLAGSAAAALGADQLAARLTKPLERIAAAAGSIGEQSLDVRIPDAAADKELRSVTTVLNQMLARLQNAFAAQQRFISDAAHELRSPLSNLRGALEVSLRRPRSAEEYRETLEDSLREVERMTRLAHDLLLLSRAEAGALGSVETRETCDLGSLAEDAVAAHLAGAGQRGVRIDVSAPVSTPVRGDADQLREVIDNLLDNAVRYAPSGSSVQVRVQANAASAEIEVRDAGPGISATDQLHIFERFYRADRSRARDSGGTGLGLSIAKAIIAAHNGEIWVDSELGRGAAFHFRLPLAQPSPAPAATSRLERID